MSPRKTKEKKMDCGGDSNDDEEFEYHWYCLKCGVDMGPNNPRQLCRKYYCPNDPRILCMTSPIHMDVETPTTTEAIHVMDFDDSIITDDEDEDCIDDADSITTTGSRCSGISIVINS